MVVARRTQAARREATVSKLIDASTDALIEVGYGKTSVQEICRRAGFTQGALFRHFGSRIELLITVAEHVGDGLLELYRQDFERLRGRRGDELALALELLRSNVQSRLHQAWFELLMAARTDPLLHQALVPIWARRDALTLQLARTILPASATALPEFAIIVDTIVTLFHGEAVDRFLRINTKAEELRMAWLLARMQEMIGSA